MPLGSKWRGEYQKSNLTGEIIKIDRKEDGSIIIGDKSVGALSMFPHAEPTVEFNCLAFLNQVNDALDAKL